MRRGEWLGVLAVTVLVLPAAAQEEAAAIPEIALEGLEPAVAEHVREERAVLAALLREPTLPAAEKAAAWGRFATVLHAYNLSAATAAYEQAVALDPEEPRWPYALGRLHQGEGRLEEARRALERAAALQPQGFLPRYRLGEIALAGGELTVAQAHLTAARERALGEPAVLAALGELALAQGRPAEAVELLSAALTAVPTADRLHHPLALAYRALGDLDRARQHLEQRGSIGLAPADPLDRELGTLRVGERLAVLEGRRAFAAGDFAAAANAFRRAAEAAPGSAAAQVNLAAALAALDDWPEARQALERALELEPESATAAFNLGVLLAREGDAEEATRWLTRALEIDPADGQAAFQLGSVLEDRGRPEEALTAYTRVSPEHPQTAAARYRQGVVLVSLGRYQEAGALLEEAHRAHPQIAALTGALARLLAACPDTALRDGDRALGLALEAHQAVPTAFHAETVALALAELSRCTEAAVWQQRAIDAARSAGNPQDMLQRDLLRYQAAGGGRCRPPIDPPSSSAGTDPAKPNATEPPP
jgi:tetratricopeptide (TPR) repeat protein